MAATQPPSCGAAGLRYRYRLAVTNLLIAARLSPEPRHVAAGDVVLPRALLNLDAEGQQHLLRPLAPVRGLPKTSRDIYLRTIEMFFQRTRGQEATARADAHPSQHLALSPRRLEDLTGLDLAIPASCIDLLLALHIHRLQEKRQ